MKRVSLSVVYLICQILCLAQTIENPVFDRTDVPSFHVDKVEITKDSTFVYCSYYAEARSWANISPDTYLEDVATGKKYQLSKCEGLPFSPQKRIFEFSERIKILMTFPVIKLGERINIIGNPNESSINIYGINLKEHYEKPYQLSEYSRLYDMTEFWISAKDSSKSIASCIKEVEASRFLFGDKSRSYISKLNRLSEIYHNWGNLNKSILFSKKAADLCVSVCKELNNPIVRTKGYYLYDDQAAFILEALLSAHTYFQNCQSWNNAKFIAQNILIILKETPDNAIHIPDCLYMIGFDSYYNKQDADAEKYFLSSYQEFEKLGRKVDENYCNLLNGLVMIYYTKGNYNESLRYAKETCTVSKRLFGDKSKEFGFALAGLSNAEIMLNQGDSAIVHAELSSKIVQNAKDVDLQTKEVYKSRIELIKNSLNYHNSSKCDVTNNFQGEDIKLLEIEANKDLVKGDYDSAIDKYRRIKKYQEEYFEKIDLYTYLMIVSSLSNALTQEGSLIEADKVIDNALDLLSQKKINTNLIRHLYSSKGMIYYSLGDYLSSIKYLRKAHDLFVEAGDKSISYARLLGNISLISIYIKDYNTAKEQIDIAYTICKDFYSDKSPNAFDILLLENTIAIVYLKIGDNSKAKEILENIISHAKKPEHESLKSLAMANLAEIYLSDNKWNNAINILEETMKLKMYGYVKDQVVFDYLFSKIVKKDDTIINDLVKYNDDLKNAIGLSFNRFSEAERENYWDQQSRKLVFLDNLSLLSFDTPILKQLAYNNALYTKNMWINSCQLLNRIISNSNDIKIKESYSVCLELKRKLSDKSLDKDSIDLYKQQIVELEKKIISRIPNFSELLKQKFKSFDDVKEMLSENDVAIEFIFLPEVEMPIENTKLRYAALILTKKDKNPHLIPLCGEKELDDLMVTDSLGRNWTDSLYNIYDNRLYNLLWSKIEEYIKPDVTIYYSPTGSVNRINLSAISDGKRRLSDKYTIYEVSTTAIIEHNKIDRKGVLQSAILYGDIDYDEDMETMTLASNKYKYVSSGILLASRSLKRNTWDYIPGTKDEIERIGYILNGCNMSTRIFVKSEANEESLKSLDGHSPDIIHIATHGFYFPSGKNIFFNNLGNFTSRDRHLQYSGLLFAGANNVWLGKTIKNMEDGILTADEISYLDLNNTDIVVLSACDTGLGDVDKINGVFGLQLGFKRAGVESVLMSLWKVDDEATKILMIEFYKNLMSGKTKHQSLKDAQKYLRSVENGKYNDPKYWASFIMLDGLN